MRRPELSRSSMYHNKKETHESISHISRLEGSGYRRKAARVHLGNPWDRKVRSDSPACRRVGDSVARRTGAITRPGGSAWSAIPWKRWQVEVGDAGFSPPRRGGHSVSGRVERGAAMVQASCYQLVLDRKLGEYTLPEGCAIVAAGNRDSDRAATTRMPTPLRNRFVHLEFEVDVQEWSE